jgi:hypothetical protein
MTQEQKDILLKDLCARLPYGVKVQDELGRINKLVIGNADLIRLYYNDFSIYSEEKLSLPYLFPMSSMTEEQKKEYDSIIYHNVELHWERYYDVIDVDCCEELYDFYNKNHLDYRGLIPMGLAIDATGLSVYTNSNE